MVFLTVVNCAKNRGPDQFWKRRKVLKLTANFFGRRRNCYSLAIRALHRALQYSTHGRRLKKRDTRELWMTRIEGASQELGTDCDTLMENMAKCKVAINHKVMSDLAIWEPRTFKCMVRLAQMKNYLTNKPSLGSLEKPPEGVFTRGML